MGSCQSAQKSYNKMNFYEANQENNLWINNYIM